MLFATFTTIFTLLASSALAAKCSSSSGAPCDCPAKFTYSQYATWAVVGADIWPVAELMNDFYHCSWRGSLPYATDGPDNVPHNSVRTSTYKTLQGTFNFSEILTEQSVQHDGSFTQKYQYLDTVGDGSADSNNSSPFTHGGGYWVDISGDYVFGNETLITWTTYLCSKGAVNDFGKLHELSFANVASLLSEQGVVTGENVAAFSVEN